MIIQNVSGSSIFNPILACDDSSVRVLNDDKLYYSQNFNSPVLALNDASHLTETSTPHIAYGLKNGYFGMIDMQRDSPLILWDVNQTLKSDAPVTIIWCGKLVDGSEDNDVVIAREDGSWEIYSYTEGDHPYIKYQINFQETIVGVGIGNVSRADYKEIMVSLFSGKISGLVDSNAEPIVQNNDKERKQKIDQLAKEKENLMKKKAKNQAIIAEKTGDEGIVGFKVQYKFTLLPKEAAYQLIIESQFNMCVLLLQSTVIIDLLDEDSIPGQISFSATDPTNSTNQFLVTIKLNESWNRLVLKIRTSEGLFGSLNAYIIPVEDSSKLCKRIDIPILPLGLHEKVSEVPNKDDLELSAITLTGNFFSKWYIKLDFKMTSKCSKNTRRRGDNFVLSINIYRNVFNSISWKSNMNNFI